MNLRRNRCLFVVLFTLVVAALVGVALPRGVFAAPVAQGNPPPGSPADTSVYDEVLDELTYRSDYTESGEVTLENGQFEDAENLIFATLANNPRAFGDVDGDGALDAVVWLATNTGGSGVFVDLAAVTDVDGDAENVATTLLGDRAQVQAIAIDDAGTITVDLVTQGPEDPLCCPTQKMRLTFVLDGDLLALASEEITGTIGDADVGDEATPSETLTNTVGTSEEITGTDALEEVLDGAATAEEDAGPLTVDENPFEMGALENATFLSEVTEDGEVTLVDGMFDDPARMIHVEVLDALRLYGDVDGDGVADALVVLMSNTGGSGTFFDLAVVLNAEGVAFNADSDLLGDRVDVQEINLARGGVITVRMVTQGPDEPMCCGTLLVDRVYEFADGTLTLVEEIDVVAAAAAAAEALANTPPSALEEFTPMAAPLVASLAMDSANPLAPNPALVAVIAGPGDLFAVDAVPLGQSCAGWISPAPTVSVQWNGSEDALRFFTVGAGDPTMAVVGPDGSVYCNDDAATEVFNPLVIVNDPQPGRYAIFVGVYDPSVAPATSLLAITTRALDPTTYAVTLPTLEASGAETGTVAGGASTVLNVEGGPETVAVRAAELPIEAELVGGGAISIFEEELGNSLCTGFASVEPVYRFAFEAGELPDALVLFYEANVDTTLIVRDPNGAFQCVDDNADYTNLNPRLEITPEAGEFAVWIGTYSANTEAPGTLTITSDLSATPAVYME